MATKLVAPLSGRGAAPAARHVVLAAEPTDAILVAPSGAAPGPQRRTGIALVWPRDEAECAAAEASLLLHAEAVHRVEEVVHWDALGDADDDAVVLVYFVRRRAGLSFEAFAAHYRERHAPLARTHHPGIARYVQNFLPPAPGVDARDRADAISELWFASERDARTRFYRDAESRRVIAEDVRRFIDLRAGSAFAARPLR